jgi:DNA-binding IclR family transcriptional regulator
VAILLADGAAWTAQAVAEHAGVSKRTAQRALAALVADGRVQRLGNQRGSRYASATGRIASRLLLLGLVPAD